MNSEIVARQFARMGARFRIVRPGELAIRRRRTDYSLDIVHDRRGQVFELQLSAEREAHLELNVLQCARHDRHLLLLVKSPEAKDRFLDRQELREALKGVGDIERLTGKASLGGMKTST